MKAADSRRVGIGLSLRDVKKALDSLTEEELNAPAVVTGREDGYDFLCYVGPAERDLRIGPSLKESSILVPKGKMLFMLQDHDID